MLTTALLRAREKGDQVEPQLIDPTRADLLAAAEALCGVIAAAKAGRWSRAELTEAIEAVAGGMRSRKIGLGLAHLLLSGVTFEVDSPVDPAELRAAAFAAARDAGGLALDGDALGRTTARDVLTAVGARWGLSPEQAAAALYADLFDAHVVTDAAVAQPAELLDRYNTSLVQALLLSAVDVRLTLASPTVPRVRQLLRHARFRQLMYRAERDDGDLVLTLDGPASLFQQTSRYGLNLALFLPAVLLQTCPWRLEARVLWGPAKAPKRLELTHTAGLKPGLADTGAWTTPEQEAFFERWAALGETGWTLSTDTAPIILGDRGVVLPDATFRKDGREAHLDIVGFWRRGWLERHLEGLQRYGPGNLVVAVSRSLKAGQEELPELPGAIIPFAKVVPAAKVLAAIEAVAR